MRLDGGKTLPLAVKSFRSAPGENCNPPVFSQSIPAPPGPANPAPSVGLRFHLRVAPGHQDGAIRAELPAGWIQQPGHHLTAQHRVRSHFSVYPLRFSFMTLKPPVSQHSGETALKALFCFHRDLLRVGVTLAGHQKKILSSIQTLRIHKAPPTLLY